jgi:hypothetical protein
MRQDTTTAFSKLRGLARLAVEGIVGVAKIVESVHFTILHPLKAGKGPRSFGDRGLKGGIYRVIRTLTHRVGDHVDATLSLLTPLEGEPTLAREALLPILNGLAGDHLAATGNPMATVMGLYYEGKPLALETRELAAAIPEPGTRLLLLVHGLCMSDRNWCRDGLDHGVALARDLGLTPLHLRYNSGLHVSTNGKILAECLQALVTQWPEPVESLAILAHSMGGLLARSACHQAKVSGQAWLGALHHLVFLGTPHHGSPWERWGHLLERGLAASLYGGPFANLGKLRSAGITDLRYGNLLDEDWQGRDPFAAGRDERAHVPLPENVVCCAMAATLGKSPNSWRTRLVGDGLVPLDSALGRHRDPGRCLDFPADRVWIGKGLGHLDLLASPEVFARIRGWLRETGV